MVPGLKRLSASLADCRAVYLLYTVYIHANVWRGGMRRVPIIIGAYRAPSGAHGGHCLHDALAGLHHGLARRRPAALYRFQRLVVSRLWHRHRPAPPDWLRTSGRSRRLGINIPPSRLDAVQPIHVLVHGSIRREPIAMNEISRDGYKDTNSSGALLTCHAAPSPQVRGLAPRTKIF